ncbi:MAG TPA: DUF5663 domain-containing protein [Candidatus Saccharimonadales bacterium]|nr:DUF5663 domain-containing protein [Candidatus Saccharimonadales bacterium]
MIKLDDDLLRELGLVGLPPDEKKKLLAHIYETLEMRVGMKLAEQMSDAQLSEFEQFIERNDEAGALQWLETNFPNYKDVVASQFEALKAEIRQVAPQILAAPRAPAPQPGMPAGMAPQYMAGPYPQQAPNMGNMAHMARPGVPMPPQPQYRPSPEVFTGQPWPPQMPPMGPPQGQSFPMPSSMPGGPSPAAMPVVPVGSGPSQQQSDSSDAAQSQDPNDSSQQSNDQQSDQPWPQRPQTPQQ